MKPPKRLFKLPFTAKDEAELLALVREYWEHIPEGFRELIVQHLATGDYDEEKFVFSPLKRASAAYSYSTAVKRPALLPAAIAVRLAVTWRRLLPIWGGRRKTRCLETAWKNFREARELVRHYKSYLQQLHETQMPVPLHQAQP